MSQATQKNTNDPNKNNNNAKKVDQNDEKDVDSSKMSTRDIVTGVKGQKTIWINGPSAPFEDHFTKVRQIGEHGQFGITWKCERKKDKKLFAVKHLNKNRFYRVPEKYRSAFLRSMHDEIEILNTLRHPNIIRLESVYEDKTTLYIVMELCTGGELFARIVQRGQYTESDAAKVIKQILQALDHMHNDNNIVHCDLKPDNILFLDEKENSPVKIIDFGMSKVLPRLKYLTTLCGTPYYTAPEIVKEKKYNHACDLWSVGVILYVMIFGYPPFYVDPKQYGKKERQAIYEKIAKGFLPEVRSTKECGYGPWFPDHIPSSKSVRELISKLLEIQVKNRYTALEALKHPWVSGQNTMNEPFLRSLARFSNTCQFKLIVIKLFRDRFQQMRPVHFHQLELVFKEMDSNKDGIVSYEEFEKVVAKVPDINIEPQYIKKMFEELDVNDNNGICFEDLLNALVHDYLIECDERLYAAFRELDGDEDGKITTEQLKAALQEIDPLGEYDRAMDIIKKESLEQNGIIDYEQFLLLLHPNFEEAPHWYPEPFKKMTSVVFEDDQNQNANKNGDEKEDN